MPPNGITSTIFAGLKTAYSLTRYTYTSSLNNKITNLATIVNQELFYSSKSNHYLANNFCDKKNPDDPCANDNKEAWYNSMPFDYLSKQVGLDSAPDVEMIADKIPNKDVQILEVGAGKGRVLEKLIRLGFTKITGFERNLHCYKSLKRTFRTRPEVTLFNADIRSLDESAETGYYAILLLWAGLCDFSKDEQLPLLQLLVKHLGTPGFIACEMPDDKNTTATRAQGSIRWIELKQASGEKITYCGYLPSSEEMESYAKHLKLELECKEYALPNRSPRFLYFFYNQPSRVEDTTKKEGDNFTYEMQK